MLRRLLTLAFLAVLALARPAAAQTRHLSPRDLWPEATAAIESGDLKSSEQRLNELLEAGKALGIRRFPIYAESAASLARLAAAEGDAEAMQWSLGAAKKLDPVSPAVAFTAADLSRSRSGPFPAVGALFDAFGRITDDYRTATIARGDLVVLACSVLAVLAAVFAFALLLRYGRAAAHDLREVLSRRFRAGTSTVLAVAVLFLPLFLWLAPFWLVLYWYVAFFAYAGVAERVAIATILILIALAPVALASTSYRLATLATPLMRGTIAALESSYYPDALGRVQELLATAPQEPELHLLAGNLMLQDGKEQEALVHFRKATEIDERIAGAHLNIGNLHFANNDFLAAITKYSRAAEIDPAMAIAHYNHSVASGELYRFDEQGQQLEQARRRDRALVERLLANPRAQKVVNYQLPLDAAWRLNRRLAQNDQVRELYGQYASFDAVRALLNPISIGALVALVAAPFLALRRRRHGTAGACIKCGRTFCHRCKASRESATYCTQCIHIYLKRDGVSLDTKRAKLAEVQSFQMRSLRVKKLFSMFVPGWSYLADGAVTRGLIIGGLFSLAVVTAVLVGRLAPIASPAEFMREAVRATAIAVAAILWIVTLVPVIREKPAAG